MSATDDDVGAGINHLPLAAAVLIGIPEAVCALAVDEDRARARYGLPGVGATADRVDASIGPLATQCGSAVDEDIGRPGDGWADGGVAAGWATMAVGWDLALVS